MIEIQVPKDITTYKTKTVGPLTMRQLVILMLVIAMDFLLYTAVLKDRNLSAEAIMYIAALIDTPVFAFITTQPEQIEAELVHILKRFCFR